MVHKWDSLKEKLKNFIGIFSLGELFRFFKTNYTNKKGSIFKRIEQNYGEILHTMGFFIEKNL